MKQCDACGCVTGVEFIEPYLNPLGEKNICGRCWTRLKKYGQIPLLSLRQGRHQRPQILYPDGSIKRGR